MTTGQAIGEDPAEASQRALEMLTQGAAQREMLRVLVHAAEAASSGEAVCSILLLDGDGLLRNACSPGLPSDYLAAIDRIRPDAKVGTCAAAAATGEVVLSPDLLADEKWSELRHLPLALGFQGAWSCPIKDESGAVIGTFGSYFRKSREPTAKERRAVELLATAAAKVLAAR